MSSSSLQRLHGQQPQQQQQQQQQQQAHQPIGSHTPYVPRMALDLLNHLPMITPRANSASADQNDRSVHGNSVHSNGNSVHSNGNTYRSPAGRSQILANMSRRLNRIASGLGKTRVDRHKLNKIIFNWPMPRQEWIDGKFVEHAEKNDEAWVELFIDLIYVVLLSSLANLLEIGKMSPQLFVKVSSSFWIMCLTRQAIDEYSNRFYCHDFVQKCIYLVYTIAVFIQASSIQYDYLYQMKESSGGSSTAHHAHVESMPYEHQHYLRTSMTMGEVYDVHLTGAAAEADDGSHSTRATRFYPPTRLYSSGFAVSLLITRLCLLLSKYIFKTKV
jgi:hypothetical protein